MARYPTVRVRASGGHAVYICILSMPMIQNIVLMFYILGKIAIPIITKKKKTAAVSK